MKLRHAVLLAGLVSLASCYEIDVRLEPDGSGSARIVLTAPLPEGAPALSVGRLRQAYEAPGVRVDSLEHLDVLDRRTVLITLSFDRLDRLGSLEGFAGVRIASARSDDQLAVDATFHPAPEGLRRPGIAGQPVRIGVRMPGIVRESDGAFLPSGRRIVWETTTDALAAGPMTIHAISGVEFEQPGPGRGALALVAAGALLLAFAGARAARGGREPHAYLVAGGLATLAYEVVLTRLFSAVFWYHFAFMAISIALLGQGTGASIVTALGPRTSRSVARPLVLTGLAIVAVLWLIVRHTHFAGDTTAGFVVLFLLAALPFLFFGLGVARIFEESAAGAGALYFCNMIGAATGAAAAIPLLSCLGAESALLVVALLAVASGAFLARGAGKAVGLALAGLLAVALAGNTQEGPLQLRTGKSGYPKQIDLRQWNSFSYITVGQQFATSWGLGKGYASGRADSVGLEIDLNAFTPIPRWRNDPSEVEEVLRDVTALVHRARRGGDVLVIGPGGGKDVLAAVALGARHVTAVEINPLIAGIVRDRFAHFTGGLYRDPRVELVVMNGRTYVDVTERRFDVIQASLVDTWAASASGAFSLTENHLYTLEAFVAYLDRLKPGGVLSVSRWHHEPPRESLRLLALCIAALEETGAKEPLRHLAVSFAGKIATVLVCKEPIDAPLRAELDRQAREMGFDQAFGGDPAADPTDPVRRLLAGGVAAIGDVSWDFSPPRDDRPFFFHTVRKRDYLRIPFGVFSGDLSVIGDINAQAVWVVLRLLLVSAAAAAALIFGPLALARRRLGGGAWAAPLAYFSCLGLGFVFIVSGHIGELSVRFGSPTLAFVTLTFTTLLGASAGAALSPAIGRRPRAAAFVVPAGLLAFAFLLGIPALRHPLPLGALMMLQGVLLGFLFPLGLEAIRSSAIVPWAFAANGALSVVAGSLSLVIALLFGFRVLLLSGVGLYLVAATLYVTLRLGRPRTA